MDRDDGLLYPLFFKESVTSAVHTRRVVKVIARTDETRINLDPIICDVYRVARTNYRPVS